jgi:hypothetical protein
MGERQHGDSDIGKKTGQDVATERRCEEMWVISKAERGSVALEWFRGRKGSAAVKGFILQSALL